MIISTLIIDYNRLIFDISFSLLVNSVIIKKKDLVSSIFRLLIFSVNLKLLYIIIILELKLILRISILFSVISLFKIILIRLYSAHRPNPDNIF